MKILHKVPWDFVLYEDGDRFLLEVVCGTIGLYEVRIELNDEEREMWSREGPEGMQALARTICSHPGDYRHRLAKEEE